MGDRALPFGQQRRGPARHAELSTADRDAATTALTRLLLRMDALRPGPDPTAHQMARHNALGALRLDEHLRELVPLGGPEPPTTLPSSRDVYQAETVRLLRQLHGRDERVVVLLHNAHLQRVPMRLPADHGPEPLRRPHGAVTLHTHTSAAPRAAVPATPAVRFEEVDGGERSGRRPSSGQLLRCTETA